MWPWIKRWRDWAINDLWPLHRTGPKPQAMHHSYEKAGVIVDSQPIPWNAEAVLVEGLLRLPAGTGRQKTDFQLRLPGRELITAESLRPEETGDNCRLFFRFPPPAETTTAELLWRGQFLTRLPLPMLSREEFVQGLRLQMPTLSVSLGEQTVACQTFVSTQCRGVVATALLSAATSLAPVVDLGLRVELRAEPGGGCVRAPVQLTSSQLRGRQAMLAVAPPKFPRRVGTWQATWLLEDQPLATQRIRAISKAKFHRSLRISETRYVTQDRAGQVSVNRQVPPRDGLARVGPCFLVSSSEAGMAGLCKLQVRALVVGGIQAPLLQEQAVLITDGPTPLAPGTVDVSDLAQVTGFDLRVGTRSLGILPLAPAPAAAFNGEGAFKPPIDYTWSAAADDELNERLAKLMSARPNGK
jgi:hypothetical protein